MYIFAHLGWWQKSLHTAVVIISAKNWRHILRSQGTARHQEQQQFVYVGHVNIEMQCIVLYCILGFCYGLHRIKIFLFCWLRKHAILLIIKKIGLPKIKCPFLCLSSLIVTLLCFCWYFLTCPFWHANVKSIVKKESFFKKCLWRPMFLERLGRWCQWLWIHCVQNYFLKIFQPKECTKSNFCDNKKKREENYKVCDDYYLEVLLLEKTDEKRTTKASFSQAGVDLKVCEVTLVLEILCCSSLMIGWLAVSPSFSLQWRQFVSLINLLCILCPFFDRYQTINAIIECGRKKGGKVLSRNTYKKCA